MARRLRSVLILPQGRINLITLQPFAELAEQGIPERNCGVVPGAARSVRSGVGHGGRT